MLLMDFRWPSHFHMFQVLLDGVASVLFDQTVASLILKLVLSKLPASYLIELFCDISNYFELRLLDLMNKHWLGARRGFGEGPV